jgi:flavorubredoxin
MTHEERKIRRQQIADSVKAIPPSKLNQVEIAKIAERFHVTVNTVSLVCREHGILQRTTHNQRKELRKLVAEFVASIPEGKRDTNVIAKAAKKFDVSASSVRMSCQEHGVVFNTSTASIETALDVLASYKAGKSVIEAAESSGVSRQYASSVVKLATEKGLV